MYTLYIEYPNHCGNFMWDDDIPIPDLAENLRKKGYWASNFPEGDGITFTLRKEGSSLLTQAEVEMVLKDFVELTGSNMIVLVVHEMIKANPLSN